MSIHTRNMHNLNMNKLKYRYKKEAEKLTTPFIALC